MKHFGQCLRAILKQKSLTQKDAAARLGWSQNTVSYYCKSENPPRPHILEHLASRLEISPEELRGKPSDAAVREATTKYKSVPPAVGFMDELRRAWQRHPQHRPVMELAVRHLWPTRAEEVLAWLKDAR